MTAQNYKILFVDDEVNILHAFKRQLRGTFNVETCSSSRQALEILTQQGPFAVVVSDMRMPELDGIQFLKEVQRINSNVVRVMLTGNADRETAVRAVNESNIFRFLNKPCTNEELTKAVQDGITQYKLIMAEHDLLHNTLSGSVKLLTDILAISDSITFGECIAIKDIVKELGKQGVIKSNWEIELGAMLIAIGNVTLPPEVVAKQRAGVEMTAAENDILRGLAQVSQRLIANIPRLEGVAKIVGYINKNFDGSGSPSDDVRGTAIPEGARILRILRDFQAAKKKSSKGEQPLATLSASSHFYDPQILADLKRFWSQAEVTDESASTSEGYEIKVADLCPGQKLLANVVTNDDVLLISAGNVLSHTMVEKIRAYAQLVGVQEPIQVDARIPTISTGGK